MTRKGFFAALFAMPAALLAACKAKPAATLVDSRQFSPHEIAKLYGVPPSAVVRLTAIRKLSEAEIDFMVEQICAKMRKPGWAN